MLIVEFSTFLTRQGYLKATVVILGPGDKPPVRKIIIISSSSEFKKAFFVMNVMLFLRSAKAQIRSETYWKTHLSLRVTSNQVFETPTKSLRKNDGGGKVNARKQ